MKSVIQWTTSVGLRFVKPTLIALLTITSIACQNAFAQAWRDCKVNQYERELNEIQ
jgi:hypothetical protein